MLMLMKKIHNAYGASLDLKLGNKVWAGGEYVKTETQGANGEAWIAGLGYGNYNMAKQGTWSVKGQYYNIKKDGACNRFRTRFSEKR